MENLYECRMHLWALQSVMLLSFCSAVHSWLNCFAPNLELMTRPQVSASRSITDLPCSVKSDLAWMSSHESLRLIYQQDACACIIPTLAGHQGDCMALELCWSQETCRTPWLSSLGEKRLLWTPCQWQTHLNRIWDHQSKYVSAIMCSGAIM